jgi:SEC-C motif-containing protein
MEFRNKIETVLRPLIGELRAKLRLLPTLAVLDRYQFRIDAARPDKKNVPDGFLIKWRYLFALLLSNPFVAKAGDVELELKEIDQLVEKIFQTYEAGALYEPGRVRGSEKEFLARLGLAIKVREPDTLAFPEQIQKWASERLEPFNDSYFLPNFGLSFPEIMTWLRALIETSQARLDAWVEDFTSIMADIKPIQEELRRGYLDDEGARNRAQELRVYERLENNAHQSDRAHIFTADELQSDISRPALEALVRQFGMRPGDVPPEFAFPHDENPLEYKLFIGLPDSKLYFLDPANAYRIVAKTFERALLADGHLRKRYLKNRDRATERWVADRLRTVFPSSEIYRNYFVQKGSYEKDILIRHGNTILIIECKNSKIRPFKGKGTDLLNFEEDFRNSVQYAYGQGLDVKSRILRAEETIFVDEKGKFKFSIKRDEVKKFFIVCVTIPQRGPFGTDLSFELKKPNEEPFPLALNLFDLDSICKHTCDAEQFVGYLRAREPLHGRVSTGDELNYAGYFLKHGNLNFQDGTFVADDFSGMFDRAWYKEKGIDVEEPKNPPVMTTVTRQGNRVRFEHTTGRNEVVKVPPEWVERATGKPVIRMKGSERNMPCPCGSGRKLKYCHGV